MKKKLILLTITLLASMQLIGCTETESSDKTEKSAETENNSIENEITPAIEEVNLKELIENEEYKNKMIDFAGQFVSYGALCLNYPGVYSGEEFTEQTKLEMIAFSEGLQSTPDYQSVEYNEGCYYPRIRPERVVELSIRFFGDMLDDSKLEMVDVYDNDIFSQKYCKQAYIDKENGIVANIGDWGTMRPGISATNVSIEDGKVVVTNELAMYDYMANEPEYMYELGSYYVVIEVDPYNQDNYWIADFYILYPGLGGGPDYDEESEETNLDMSEEDIAQFLVDYYTNLYNPDGSYSMFTEEDVINGNTLEMILRYVMTDEEQNERIQNGGMPVANVYVTTVYIDLNTMIAEDEIGNVFSIK